MAFYLLKKNKVWLWKVIDRDSGRLIDWELGDRPAETLKRLYQRIKQWDVQVYCSDELKAYRQVLPAARRVQSKSETIFVERDNSNTRHWFGRFRRKTKIVSRSMEMIELTIALFAKLHVNGTMDPLIHWSASLIA